MDKYSPSLKKELVEQFKGKPNIEALVEVIGSELQEVFNFYEQLRNERDLYNAIGKQLDGVGDIVVLTRMEAGKLTGNPIPIEVIDDITYRKFLIYKVLRNTCNCTYPDLIKAFRMFWNKPLYYTEDINKPATMIFRTGSLSFEEDISDLVKAPQIKAAGVGIDLGIVFEPVILENHQAFWFASLTITAKVENRRRAALERLLLAVRVTQSQRAGLSMRLSGTAKHSFAGALTRLLFRMRVHNLRQGIVYLDGRQRLDGSWQLNQGMIRGPALVSARFSMTARNPLSVSATVTADTVWRLDGTYRLDGGKKLNANIVRSEL